MTMRGFFRGAGVALALYGPGLAFGQTPPNSLLGGNVRLAVGHLGLQSNCYVNRGFSSFQRNGAGAKAVISFSEITDNGLDLNGQAVMTFTTTTSGTIHFKMTPGLTDPTFTTFTQSYDVTTRQLTVAFSIAFADCTLPIYAVYDPT